MRSWAVIFFVFLVSSQGFGADATEESKLDDSFLFTARAFGDDAFEGIHFFDADDEDVEIAFDPRFRTPVQRLPEGIDEVSFFKVLKDEKGRDYEQVVAVADLSDVESRAMLVFLAQRDAVRNLPYSVIVADESPGVFEGGTVRFLNLAGARLVGRLGDDSFPLEFGFGTDLNYDAENVGEMPIEFAVVVGDQWEIVYSTGFRVHPKYGTLVLIKPPTRADSLRVQVEIRRMRVYPELELEEKSASEN